MAITPMMPSPNTTMQQRKRSSRTPEERRALRKQLMQDARASAQSSSSSSIDSTDSSSSSSNYYATSAAAAPAAVDVSPRSSLFDSSSGSSSVASINCSQRTLHTDIGKVIPSDVAYIDQMCNGPNNFDMSQVMLYSDRKFAVTNEMNEQEATMMMFNEDPTATATATQGTTRDSINKFQIIYVHTLQYKGEIVWQLETTCNGDGGINGMVGETSTCSLSGSMLRVRINSKYGSNDASVASASTRASFSGTREKYAKSLQSILTESANEYHAFCSSTH